MSVSYACFSRFHIILHYMATDITRITRPSTSLPSPLVHLEQPKRRGKTLHRAIPTNIIPAAQCPNGGSFIITLLRSGNIAGNSHKIPVPHQSITEALSVPIKVRSGAAWSSPCYMLNPFDCGIRLAITAARVYLVSRPAEDDLLVGKGKKSTVELFLGVGGRSWISKRCLSCHRYGSVRSQLKARNHNSVTDMPFQRSLTNVPLT